MKIAGMDMPHVREDFLSKVEFECSLSIQDWDRRMLKQAIYIPHTILRTLHEIMCTAAEKTFMGNYNEGAYKTGKDEA